jgi:hypothetical protein
VNIEPIESDGSPREILAADFKSLRGGLPISGGWGYTQEDACIINRDDPLVSPGLPFNGIGIEYVFIEKRIFEEMIIFRPAGEKFSDIKWVLQQQRTVRKDGRNFDRLVFEITAFPEREWERLKAESEGPQGSGTAGFNAELHQKRRQEVMVRFTREFWFDITSFYGN